MGVGGYLLVVEGLVKRYGRVYGARGVSLHVPPRGVHGLIGPNGAGKTTTMKCIVGLAVPDSGSAVFLGENLWGPGGWRLRGLIGYVPEAPSIAVKASVRELLEDLAVYEGYSRLEAPVAARRAAEEAGVESLLDRSVKGLSKGQRKRVLFAQALLSPRELYVLDEPFTGLDPEAVAWARDTVERLSRGAAVLLSTHLLREVEDLASTAALIVGGATRYEGPIEALAAKAGGGVVYRFRVDRPREAALLLEQLARGGVRVRGDTVEAVLGSREDAAEAVRVMVSRGLKVYEAVRLKGLEQAYLRLVASDKAEEEGVQEG